VLQGNLMQTTLVGSSFGVTPPNLILTSQYAQTSINDYSMKKSFNPFSASRSKRVVSKVAMSPHKNTFYSKNGGSKPNEDLSFAWNQNEE
jgi:hypothetical protein